MIICFTRYDSPVYHLIDEFSDVTFCGRNIQKVIFSGLGLKSYGSKHGLYCKVCMKHLHNTFKKYGDMPTH